MFPFRRKRPAGTVAVVAPVTDPNATLDEMADAFESGELRRAERAADSLLGWMLHGGYPPIGFQREAVMTMIGTVLGAAAKHGRRSRHADRARTDDPNRPTRADLLHALCQEIRRIGEQARGEREMDLVIVLDALAEAASRDKLRAFAVEVDRVRVALDLP